MSKQTPNHFVVEIDIALAKQMAADLQEQGFSLTLPAHTLFSAKKNGINCTLYTSGKLVVQGKDIAPFIEFYLEPNILKKFQFSYSDLDLDLRARIGVDESGKGDFFGPLCVAAVYADEQGIRRLQELGVKDSKAIADKKILELGRKIKKDLTHHIVKINPAKYNEIYGQFKNLNRLLGWGHATCIEKLVETSSCRRVIIDQFADESIVFNALKRKQITLDLTQRHRAEEDLVVAAASILARQTFLEGLQKMQEEFGMVFPKGASAQTISAGKQFVRKFGKEALQNVGKLHFKTASVITEE